jgi:hypothetical protein
VQDELHSYLCVGRLAVILALKCFGCNLLKVFAGKNRRIHMRQGVRKVWNQRELQFHSAQEQYSGSILRFLTNGLKGDAQWSGHHDHLTSTTLDFRF